MKLPQEFISRMEALLGNEFQDFLNTYSQPRYYGYRVNTLKISIEEYLKLIGKQLERVPWSKDGFYYHPDDNPGKHPYYYAGFYYIQEPSAMAPAEVLTAQPGERVLDLCAAPGGKTMQIAADMKGEGVLVANEINSSRIKALIKNIELCGVKNAIITNETPNKLASRFGAYFDKILVDAPCSGEGMIRKDDNARKSWEVYNSAKCACIQRDILQQADIMLKPGGKLVYSTCTFSTQENEEIIGWFLGEYPNYELVEINKHNEICSGKNMPECSHSLSQCARFWPHKLKGEGHFVAALEKKDGIEGNYPDYSLNADKKINNIINDFFVKYTNITAPQNVTAYGQNIHAVMADFPNTTGINVVRTGWRLGSIDRDNFEPSQSMIMGLASKDIKNVIAYNLDSIEVIKYLKGETLFAECADGWGAVCIGEFPLGWVKSKNDTLKNHYPKGWRKIV